MTDFVKTIEIYVRPAWEVRILCSQEQPIGLFPESDESKPYPLILFP
jgi:hypothetical protein